MIHIIPHNRITDTVKFYLRIIRFQEFLICLLNTSGIQRIDIFPVNLFIPGKFLLHMSRDCPQYTSCRSNTDIFEFPANFFLQMKFYFFDGRSHLMNVMNLSIQHSARFMFPYTLRDYMEPFSGPVSYRSHNASCPDIQPEHQLARKFHHF